MPDAAWHPDPLGRYELRWWDGEQWTEHVATGGQQGVDPEPIVVGGVGEQAAADQVEHDTAGADAGGAAAVGTGASDAAAGSDIGDFAPPRAEDAIQVDDDAAAQSWPTAEQSTATGHAEEEPVADESVAAGQDADEEPAAQEPAAEEPAAEEAAEEPAAEEAAEAEQVTEDEHEPDEHEPDEHEPDERAPMAEVDEDVGDEPAADVDPATADTSTEPPLDEEAAPMVAPPGSAVLAVAAPSAGPEAATTQADDLGPDGIGGGLLDDARYAERSGERVMLQNPRMLKVSLGRDVFVKRGSMVAYQGEMQFEAVSEGGGLGGLVRRAASSDNSKIARVSGSGDLFLADNAYEVHVLELGGGGLVVNGPNLLAFEDGMTFVTRSLGNAGVAAGGVFVTDVSGTGWVAVTSSGTPVRLSTDAPTYVDAGAAVAWSSSLNVDLKVQKLGFRSMRSGELVQLAFRGEGFVLVQSSEGAVPTTSH